MRERRIAAWGQRSELDAAHLSLAGRSKAGLHELPPVIRARRRVFRVTQIVAHWQGPYLALDITRVSGISRANDRLAASSSCAKCATSARGPTALILSTESIHKRQVLVGNWGCAGDNCRCTRVWPIPDVLRGYRSHLQPALALCSGGNRTARADVAIS